MQEKHKHAHPSILRVGLLRRLLLYSYHRMFSTPLLQDDIDNIPVTDPNAALTIPTQDTSNTNSECEHSNSEHTHPPKTQYSEPSVKCPPAGHRTDSPALSPQVSSIMLTTTRQPGSTYPTR